MTHQLRLKSLAFLLALSTFASGQNPYTGPQRTRLILKDGSYQVVTSYHVSGKNVVYTSAERSGAQEEVPLSIVDWQATEKWQQDHAPGKAQVRPELDPELVREEEARRAITPEVATNLHLPDDMSVLALDTFQGTPELVPLTQSSGELNKQTAHNIMKAVVNPLSSSHQVVELKGARSAIQLHVADPAIYVRVGEDESEAPSNAFTVNTNGASQKSASTGGNASSTYVIVRTDIRRDLRIVSSFKISLLGTSKRQEDVVETVTDVLPGGHWIRLTPKQPLGFGEYALMEVLSEKEINIGVWDFGVHPTASENREAIKPQERHRPQLDSRRP